MTPYWISTTDSDLAQGDFLPSCVVPLFSESFGENNRFELALSGMDLIVMTQSCDLVNAKMQQVALCPIDRIAKFEAINPQYAKKGNWESVRKGRIEGLHLVASPEQPQNNRDALVVDFRSIVSLPFPYLSKQAGRMTARWRFQSPFLEHFSQAFARFFMRVGLPAAIPPYK